MTIAMPILVSPYLHPLQRRERSWRSATGVMRIVGMAMLLGGLLIAFTAAGTKKANPNGTKCTRFDGLKLMFDGSHDDCKCAQPCGCCSDRTPEAVIVVISSVTRCYDGCCNATP